METKERGLGKVNEIEIKKSMSGFVTLSKEKIGQAVGVFSPECPSTGTEGHHASHVLTFFSYMAYNAVKGKDIRQHLLERVIHHLTALQEFIEDPELSTLVKSILESIHIQYGKFPEDAQQSAEIVSLWLASNQKNILKLAGCYGKQSVFDGLLPIKILVGSTEVTGTAIRGLRGRHLPVDEHRICGLFQGYFNNKMTLLIFLIRDKRIRLNAESVKLACRFLDDIYCHMLAEGLQRKYRLVFLWLKKFFLKLPDVTAAQRNKAVEFICLLYEIFGIHLNKGGQK